MITVSVLGLDQYVVGHISKDCSGQLAQLFEVSLDDVDFYAPNAFIFHNGVEQTSWNTLVRVHLPKKLSVLEKDAVKILYDTISKYSVHLAIEFYYYSQDNRYDFINDDYPRFIKEDNVVHIEDDYDESEDEDIDHEHEEEEVYTGNIFEGFEEKIKEKQKDKK